MKMKFIIITTILYFLILSPSALSQLYVASYGGGIYYSTDTGENWSPFTLHPYGIAHFKFNPYDNNNILYCCAYDGLWKVNIHEPEKPVLLTGPGVIYVNDICFDHENPGVYYIAAMNGVFKSGDNGTSWYELKTNSAVKYSSVVRYINQRILIGMEDGLYFSDDGGESWNMTVLYKKPVRCLIETGKVLIAGTEDFGIYMSSDNGKTWHSCNYGLKHLSVYALAYDPENKMIYAGTYGGGIYYSNDFCRTWKQLVNNLSDEIILDVAISNRTIYASCYWKGLFRSLDNGSSFDNIGFTSKGHYGISTILVKE